MNVKFRLATKKQPTVSTISVTKAASRFLQGQRGSVSALDLVNGLIEGEYGRTTQQDYGRYMEAARTGIGTIVSTINFNRTVVLAVAIAKKDKPFDWQWHVLLKREWLQKFNPLEYARQQEAGQQARENRPPIEPQEDKPAISMYTVDTLESLAGKVAILVNRIDQLEREVEVLKGSD